MFDNLVADLSSAASSLVFDNADDTQNEMGPLISAKQKETVTGYLDGVEAAFTGSISCTAPGDCLAAGTNCGTFVPPAHWPTIRGAMTWSINWDASNGYAFANTVHGHLVTMP